MILEETHNLAIENRGNRFVAQLRPAKHLLRRLASQLRYIGTRMSRAYIEDRMLHAALEAELYRGRYKHSNKNDDDLPVVGRTEALAPAGTMKEAIVGGIRRAQPVIIAFTIFALVLAGIIALRVAIWLPTFNR